MRKHVLIMISALLIPLLLSHVAMVASTNAENETIRVGINEISPFVNESWVNNLLQHAFKKDCVIQLNIYRSKVDKNITPHEKISQLYLTIEKEEKKVKVKEGKVISPDITIWIKESEFNSLISCKSKKDFIFQLYNIYLYPKPSSNTKVNSVRDYEMLNEVLNQDFIKEAYKEYTPSISSLQWKYTTNGEVQSSPSICNLNKDDKLETIIGSNEGYLYCLNSTGKLLWRYETKGAIKSAPAIADIDMDGKKEIVMTSEDGNIYCLSKEGAQIWNFATGSKIFSSPAIADIDNDGSLEILVGSYDKELYCLNKEGKEKWKYSTKGKIHSSPSIRDLWKGGGLEIVFGSDDGYVYCLDMRGSELWKFKTEDWVTSSPVIDDIDGDNEKEVIVGSNDDKLYCINKYGFLKWDYTAGWEIVKSPSIADIEGDGGKNIIFSSFDHKIYCLNPDGNLKWSYEFPHPLSSSLAIANVDDDRELEILGGSFDNALYCISKDGAVEWKYSTDSYVMSTPSIADIDNDSVLEIIFGSCDNSIYCLEKGNGGGLPWPMFQHDLLHTGTYGNNPPRCTVIHPNGGEILHGVVNVTAFSFDPNLGDVTSSVEFEYSNDWGATWNFIENSSSPPWSVYWNTTLLPDGKYYQIRARSFDERVYSDWDESDFFFSISNLENKQPIASFTYSPLCPIVNQTIVFNASDSYDPDGYIVEYKWKLEDGYFINTTNITATYSYHSIGEYIANLTVVDDDGATNTTSKKVRVYAGTFDTEEGTYPSISGIHNGTIKLNKTIIVHKLFTYPCTGTGGHTKYARIWNSTWSKTATWSGYIGDWKNITFNKEFILLANETYNYTIRTGSYPQIHHTPMLQTATGWINCTSFVDVNGKEYSDWIPAIKFF